MTGVSYNPIKEIRYNQVLLRSNSHITKYRITTAREKIAERVKYSIKIDCTMAITEGLSTDKHPALLTNRIPTIPVSYSYQRIRNQ